MRLTFHIRLTPIRSAQAIDPPRIEAAVAGLPAVASRRVHDDRLAGGSFVTLVIQLESPDIADLAALQRAVTSIHGVSAFAQSMSGALTPLAGFAPERLPSLAHTREPK